MSYQQVKAANSHIGVANLNFLIQTVLSACMIPNSFQLKPSADPNSPRQWKLLATPPTPDPLLPLSWAGTYLSDIERGPPQLHSVGCGGFLQVRRLLCLNDGRGNKK